MTDEDPHCAGNAADLAVHLQKHEGKGHGRHIHGRGEVIQQGVLSLEVMPADGQSRRDTQKNIQCRLTLSPLFFHVNQKFMNSSHQAAAILLFNSMGDLKKLSFLFFKTPSHMSCRNA